MHKTHTATILALLILALPYLSLAITMPLGGLVTVIRPCDEGLLLTVKEFAGVKNYMWLTGELPYAMFVVPHPGQFLLGQSALAPVKCTISGASYGSGQPIIFHGSSI